MAVSTSFKQQCPTCEAMVPIRSAALIGKKIDCPKCKDKFVVENPNGGNGKAAKPQKKRFRDDEDEVDETDEQVDAADEVDEAEMEKLKTIGKKKGKKKKDHEEEEEEDDKKDKKKKKKAGAKNMNMGLVLAGVGLAALAIAAYFLIFRGSGTAPKGPGPTGPPIGVIPGTMPEDPMNDGKDKGGTTPIDGGTGGPLLPPTPALTNLLPPDTQHVFHAFLKDIFDSSLIRAAGLDSPGAYTSASVKENLGFSLLNVDDVIRAEKFSPDQWVFTVIHLKEEVSLPKLTTALGLEKQERIKGRDYFLAKKSNPVFDRLARASFGVPLELQQLAEGTKARQTYVHVHDRQTLIFADKEPLVDFLHVEGRFPMVSVEEPDPTPKGGPGGPPIVPPGSPTFPPTGMMGMPPEPSVGMMGGMPPGTMPPSVGMMGSPPMPMGMMGTPPMPMPMPMPMGMMGTPPGPSASMMGGPSASMMGGPSVSMMGGEGMMGGTPAPPTPPPSTSRRIAYRTLRNSKLKSTLDRMETPAEEKDKVLFSSATDLTAAVFAPPGADHRGKVLYRPRLAWDVTLLLDERRPRLQSIGTGMVQRDSRKFQYREELVCLSEEDAKEMRKELRETQSRDIVRFVDRLLGHGIEMPPPDLPPMPPPGTGPYPGPGGMPMPGPGGSPMFPPPPPMGGSDGSPMPPYGTPGTPPVKTEATKSRLLVEGVGKVIDYNLDLILDSSSYRRLENVVTMFAASLGAELETVNAELNRHTLAMGVKTMAEKGSTRIGPALPPGKYPPASFARPSSPTRLGMLPDGQVSWMAALLPFVGQEALHRKIRFEDSWRDSSNWMAGRTLVPQFLDPTYPDSSRFVAYDDLPIEMGATHYVGISGIGLDAASYKPGDPATIHKRGVFGYGRQLAFEEIKSGRGLSNVAVMIQIPHDSPTGVTPWIAGGGATTRGVPEKNSIAPFILGKDRTGKVITQDGKRGTYVLMSDGSVRFVDQNVSDDVFKAMVTVQGPAPKYFDLNGNEHTPLVLPPGGKAPPTTKTPTPPTKVSPPEKKPFFPFPFPKKATEPKTEPAPPMKKVLLPPKAETGPMSFLDAVPRRQDWQAFAALGHREMHFTL